MSVTTEHTDFDQTSLAVCIVEAFQSCVTDATDTAVVVDRYVAYRDARGRSAEADGTRALLRTFEEVGGCDQWAGKVGNYRRRYSDTSAPVACAAIEHAAELLYTHRIDTRADLERAVSNDTTTRSLESGFRAIAGTADVWDSLLRLVGLSRSSALVGTAIA